MRTRRTRLSDRAPGGLWGGTGDGRRARSARSRGTPRAARTAGERTATSSREPRDPVASPPESSSQPSPEPPDEKPDESSSESKAEPPPGSRAEREQLRYAWRALSVVGLASVLIALNVSTLNVALPAVARHFQAGSVAASWILLSYMLANTVLLVVFGRLADMFGRREMYLSGMAVFTVASLLCGLAPSVWSLVALRVVQAAGGAMILVNSAAIVSDAFPRRLLNRGLGIYLASFSVASLLGPSVGGFVAAAAGWRWVFWFNVPVGVVCVIWGAVTLRKVPRAATKQRLDLPGNLLLLVALSALLLGLSEAQNGGWDHPVFFGGVAAFAAVVPIFFVVERRMPNPVVDTGLFRDRPFTLSMASAFVTVTSRFSVVLLMGLFFQAVHGDSPFEAGLKVIPLPVATMIASVAAGTLERLAPPQVLAVAGGVISVVGSAFLLTVISADVSYGVVAVALTAVGLGGGVFMPANTTSIILRIPGARLGVVNAMRLMVQNIGIMLGTAVSFTLITGPLPPAIGQRVFAGTLSELSPEAVHALVAGYRHALAVVVCAAVIGTVTALASASASRRSPVPQRDPPAE